MSRGGVGVSGRPGQWRRHCRVFALGIAAGMGLWMGMMGAGLPPVGPDLGRAIARAERAPLRWIPKIWLVHSVRRDAIPPAPQTGGD